MKKTIKEEKGITLIALVITIIVMLILVTVTIRVATDGNLFTHAANAARDTKTAIQGENAILNDELDKSIEDIVSEQTEETPAPTIIQFTIAGTPYDAEDGMTWEEWVADTRYNTDGFKISGGGIRTSDESKYVERKSGRDTFFPVFPDNRIASAPYYLQDVE